MSEETTKKRPHDVTTPAAFAELMKSGWIPTPLEGLKPTPPLAYYTGVQGVEATADSVLVMQPNGSGHDVYLSINPCSTRFIYTAGVGITAPRLPYLPAPNRNSGSITNGSITMRSL